VNYGNGVTESFSYNDRRQLTQQSLVKNNSVIQQYDYAYGVVDQSNGNVDASKNTGQIARIEGYIGGTPSLPDKQWQQRFSYDTLGRLTQSSEYRNYSGTLSLTYKSQFDYDRWGNRYRKVANNPNSLPFIAIEDVDVDKVTNRFSSSTNTTYDEVGNVITDNKFRNLSYRYDANGRMVWSQNSNGQGSESKTVYNAVGNRVASLVNGQWRYFVYDIGGNLLAEYGQATITTEKVRYYMQDHQASTRVVMNNSASVISRTDYQAFGEEIGADIGRRTTTQGYGQIDNNRQRYAMTEKDEATGLEHTWFRKYDNKAGRWTSPDPYKGSMSRGNPQSFNRYSYVQNDPINNADPSGLATCNVTFWFLVSSSNVIYIGFTVNYCWGANPDTNGGGSHHGTGRQQDQKGQQQKPCDAKLTGNADIDKIAQYFFGESASGNTETYAFMKAIISNRIAAGIKEFGCTLSEVLDELSTIDDDYNRDKNEGGNKPFRQAANNEELAKLNEVECANFKKAQQAARETYSALPAFGSRSYTTPSGIGWPPLFWLAGNKGSDKGQIGVGDTTFYSHDPNNGRGWSNYYDYKIRKAHSDTPEWRCP
jgi:RHS repeat-associated protein